MPKLILAFSALCAVALAGCGGSSHSAATTTGGASTSSSSSSGPSALSAEATSARTGDIPDNQSFLTFRDSKLGASMAYPEGWTVQRRAGAVTFRSQNNLVRISVTAGSAPTAAGVQTQLAALEQTDPSLTAGAPQQVSVKAGPALKVTYKTRSAPNPVTGKSVTLTVDRYELARGGWLAVVDLGTPVGVDNVDAYKMMIGSFKWL
jgi:hypothetical protein